MSEVQRPQRDEEQVRQFVENMSSLFANFGMQRMAARVLVAELVAPEETLTAAELADRLGASPAAISNALKYLTNVGLFRRESIPNSRRDRYRMTDHSWYVASFLKSGRLEMLADEADKAVDAVGGPDTVPGARLGEMRDFYRFIAGEMSAMIDTWLRMTRGDSPPEPGGTGG